MKTLLILAAVVIAATTIGFASAQSEPPSQVNNPPAPITREALAERLANAYGETAVVRSSLRVTAADLRAMGISHPEWEGGEPDSMTLVALGGSYQVPLLTQGESESMPGDLVIMVIDDATGVPTVTIVTSGAEAQGLLAAIQDR